MRLLILIGCWLGMLTLPITVPFGLFIADPPACDCCVFTERQATNWQTRIAPDTAAGQPLQLSGTVYESDGKTPARDVLMYFYHTNASGRYAKLGTEPRTSHAWWHGYCRGWLRTDRQGRYQINTIRPAPYPDRSMPAHIHFYVKAPSQRTCYYLSDFVFADDPLLTESYWSRVEEKDGFLREQGVTLTRQGKTLVGRRDIQLLPQYDKAGRQSGLRIGDACPAFSPRHVWGPDRGKRTCPMCAYGMGQGLLLWTRSMRSDTIRQLARFWDGALAKPGRRSFRVFIIYTNPRHLRGEAAQAELETFARQLDLRRVALLYVSDPTERSTAFLYNINPAVGTTALFYQRRTVTHKWVDGPADSMALNQQLAWLN